MAVFQTIGFILLFIVCISILIIVHELGHLCTAKMFHVYCLEFSVGMGPAFLHKKRKDGETYFSLRSIPFGGYVSMYDKGVELPEGLVVDESRQFSKIAKWKRAIVLFAGVFNNAILALIIFFISEACFEQKQMYLNLIDVEANSVAEKAGLTSLDTIKVETVKSGENSYYVLDKTAFATYEDKVDALAVVLSTNVNSYDKRSYDDYVSYHFIDNEGTILSDTLTPTATGLVSVDFVVTETIGSFLLYKSGSWVQLKLHSEPVINPQYGDAYVDDNSNIYVWDNTNWIRKDFISSTTYPETPKELELFYNPEFDLVPHYLSLGITENDKGKAFESIGLSYHLEAYYNDIGTAFKQTFVDFGQSSVAIVQTVASLFYSRETWGQIGGIVSIGVQTSSILQNMGVGKFLYVWGLISVNLAIVNLLPFPGLDGWQILVIAVEAIAHKDIPEKVKSIMSMIGIALLFAFMIIILIKDVIGLF